MDHHEEVLDVVTKFIGLAPMSWKEFEVHSNTRDIVSPSSKDSSEAIEQPVMLDDDDSIGTELRQFYESFGTQYYDFAKMFGYWGCRPW